MAVIFSFFEKVVKKKPQKLQFFIAFFWVFEKNK
jgi:hypothetical protein